MRYPYQIFFVFLILIFGEIYSNNKHISCIVDKDNREIYRNNYTYPETIESENFVIHFTTSNVDSQYVNGQWFNLQSNYGYAESISNHLESALSRYLNDGWENIPPDCDESIDDLNSPEHCINFGGNSLYDVYISNDGVGMVVPENPYSVEPYSGGYTSYMKISTLSNAYDSIPSWSYHVIAHELHHSIQLRYGYSVSGSPGNYIYNGWFLEQTATYMENVIYPNSIHLKTMLANCDVVTPLTYPDYNIDYPAEIYPYRSALWQKFLVESLGDSSIIRYMWEDYGTKYAEGNAVSLFPIYNDAVEKVTNYTSTLSDAYANYALWRYFTGDRSLPNQYFNESSSYCTSSNEIDFENSFILPSNKGSSRFIDLPSQSLNLIISTDFPEEINFTLLEIDQNNNINFNNLNYNDNYSLNILSDLTNVLIANSNYNYSSSNDIVFSIAVNNSFNIGDVNLDGGINVLDIIIIVDLILSNEYNINGDINDDNQLNIVDVVQIINLILD